MADSRFVFAVDLDGVVADFYGGIRRIAADWLGVPEAELPTEVTHGLSEWNIDDYGGYETLHRFAVTQRELFKSLTPIPGAPQVLRRLSTGWRSGAGPAARRTEKRPCSSSRPLNGRPRPVNGPALPVNARERRMHAWR